MLTNNPAKKQERSSRAREASIWPIQLRDKNVGPSASSTTAHTGSKKLTYVHLDQLDFEEVSYLLDFDYISSRTGPSNPVWPQGNLSQSSNSTTKRKRAPSDADVIHVLHTGKRKVKDEQIDANIADRADLIDTYCLFHIKARNARDTDLVLELKERLQDDSSEELMRIGELGMAVSSSSTARMEDSIITHTMWLHDPHTGQTVASLPILKADALQDQSPHLGKLTNGQWLASLSYMLEDKSLTATVALSLYAPPSDYPSDRITAGSLFLKLSVKVQVGISRAAGASLSSNILDMARVVRFADVAPDAVDSISETEEVDASFVYRNLRPATIQAPAAIQHPDLAPTLLPFQRRSTAFVLGREGKVVDEQGNLRNSDSIIGHDGPSDLGLWWKRIGPDLYYNWIETRFVRDRRLTQLSDCKGAMLAEEMGLGKTVEAVALMLLNPDLDAAARDGWYDDRNEINVLPTKTTLIVAPETLRAQWTEEIERHAPDLSVYLYQSRTKAEQDVPDGRTWEQWAQCFDVMIVSYATLAKELDIAKKEPSRSRRHERKYERPRSPLIKLHFHRVLMDEVQMVGLGRAAETVSMISRSSSIAVSGTPVKKTDDLKSCFRFLKVPGHLANSAEWQAILHPLLAPALVCVLRTIGTRHTKSQVASEMSLPIQTRSVIPIDFTSIETAFYADVWKDALSETGYSPEGNPQTSDHHIDVYKMRQHLLLLRQACTHPQVALQFRGGVVGSKNLRSIDEVLELMIDSTRNELHSQKLHWFDRRIHRNILVMYRRDEDQHILAASQLNDVEQEINAQVLTLEQEIRDAAIFGPLYRFTEHELDLERKVEASSIRFGAHANIDEDGDAALEALFQDPEAYRALLEKRKARANHVTTLKAHLRWLLMKLHQLLQFSGNLYYQRGEFLDERERAISQKDETQPAAEHVEPGAEIKVEDDSGAPSARAATETISETKSAFSDDADQKHNSNALAETKPVMSEERQSLKDKEDASYAKAEKVRQRLLIEHGDAVSAAIAKLNRDQVRFDAEAMRVSSDLFDQGGGIQSSQWYEVLADDARLLNEHATTLFEWRDSIMTRLVRVVNRDVSLEQEDDDQYRDNLDTQAEAEALLEMYRTLLAEREMILKGAVAVGSLDRPRLFKELEVAARLARQNELRGIAPETEADEEVLRGQEQQLAHFKKLDEERESVSLHNPSLSITHAAEHLKSMREHGIPEEAALARQAFSEARRIISEQSKFLDKLRIEEKTVFATLFNARSRYFKEIQVLSDTVSDPVFANLEQSIRATQKEEIDQVSKVDELERRLRYLLHLQMVQSADQLDEEAKLCNICTDPIEIGILTNKCGHVCCEQCWKVWQAQGHRTCVLCQTRVLPTEVHRIIYSTSASSAQNGQVASAAQGTSAANTTRGDAGNADPLGIRYNELSDSLRGTLNRLSSQGRFGSKIDHVTKHVCHIVNTTGEKSLIFSSFGRGLDVVAQSLTANGIRFVRLTGAGKSGSAAAKLFTSDPSIHVMLLHSEAQSAGLNLLAASHIHILEPMLNTSLELQAIGRVHRIGQTKQTNVWCYYVKDTVEERILALSAYKGQSLYLQGRSTSSSDGPTTLESSAKGSAAEHSRQDAKKWSAFGEGARGGQKGQLRADVTNNSNELLACFFARYLPLLGSLSAGSVRKAGENSTRAGSSNGIGAVVDGQPSEVASGSGGGAAQEDELTKLRKARLAALEQRQANTLN